MYKVTFKNGTTEYFEEVVFIKKQKNGFFAPASREEATGVCLKLPKTSENEEGEMQTYYSDEPFLFEEVAEYRGGASDAAEVDTTEELTKLSDLINIIVGGEV